MKKIFLPVLVLVLVLAISGAAVAESALDSFNSLAASSALSFSFNSSDLLDGIMNGTYNAEGKDPDSTEQYASQLSAIASIKASEISSYAAAKNLPVAQVRNAYYRALANVLAADIEANPAFEKNHRDIQNVLSLFLDHAGDAASVSDRQTIRSSITRTNIEQIAEDYQLPVFFVEFLIMDENWHDDLWENDNDWYEASYAYAGFTAGSELSRGSKDKSSTSEVATMQQALIKLNYLSGKADGIFGAKTERALIEFQLANGLSGSGVYDASTRSVLTSGSAVARTDYVEDFYVTKTKSSSSGSSSSSSSRNPSRSPDRTPDRTADRTPDNTPDRSPDRTPDRT